MSEMMQWTEMNLSAEALALVQAAGFQQPSQIQSEAIPKVLTGKDLIASSRTGSGKTAAFVLPMVEKLFGRKGTYGLILAPTREIAQQIQATIEIFGHPRGVGSGVLIGGVDYRYDEEVLRRYPSILVATPGRLVDHIEKGNVWLEFIEILVLDEADRMLEMGFASQLNRIVAETQKTRQTLLFSATMPPEVEKLAQAIMKDPDRITVGTVTKPTDSVEHRFIELHPGDKIACLKSLMESETGTIMVFVDRKLDVTRIYHQLHSEGYYDVVGMHSDLPQSQREKVLADFKERKYRVLIATDIVGRGIHVDNVAHVVNYDFPREAEDYVHRIGRTGRQDQKGIATSLVTRRDKESFELVKKALESNPFSYTVFGGAPENHQESSPTVQTRSSRPKALPKEGRSKVKIQPARVAKAKKTQSPILSAHSMSSENKELDFVLSDSKRKKTIFPI